MVGTFHRFRIPFRRIIDSLPCGRRACDALERRIQQQQRLSADGGAPHSMSQVECIYIDQCFVCIYIRIRLHTKYVLLFIVARTTSYKLYNLRRWEYLPVISSQRIQSRRTEKGGPGRGLVYCCLLKHSVRK